MAKGLTRGRSSLPSKSLDCCTILSRLHTAKSSRSRTPMSLVPKSVVRLARSFESCLILELCSFQRTWYPSWKHLANPSRFQTAWFAHIHVEQNLQTAIDRYGNESRRIMGVVDSYLSKQKQKLGLGADDPVWLVGEKCTFTDLAFVSWNTLLPTIFPGDTLDLGNEFPEYYRWNANMIKRSATRKVLDFREECIRTMKDTGIDVVERQVDARQLPKYEKSLGVGVA
ncbi:hypothetical protein K449DRAFT_460134 [Hypoxylon sp. EC38]|nr:hypothetical protein K449DRAFT_460134 [Hypoxylon sp. EC38]